MDFLGNVIYKKYILVIQMIRIYFSNIFGLCLRFLAHSLPKPLESSEPINAVGASFFIIFCHSILSSLPEVSSEPKGKTGVFLFLTNPFSSQLGLC